MDCITEFFINLLRCSVFVVCNVFFLSLWLQKLFDSTRKRLLMFFCSTSLFEQIAVRRATQASTSVGFCLVQFEARTQNCFV